MKHEATALEALSACTFRTSTAPQLTRATKKGPCVFVDKGHTRLPNSDTQRRLPPLTGREDVVSRFRIPSVYDLVLKGRPSLVRSIPVSASNKKPW